MCVCVREIQSLYVGTCMCCVFGKIKVCAYEDDVLVSVIAL